MTRLLTLALSFYFLLSPIHASTDDIYQSYDDVVSKSHRGHYIRVTRENVGPGTLIQFDWCDPSIKDDITPCEETIGGRAFYLSELQDERIEQKFKSVGVALAEVGVIAGATFVSGGSVFLLTGGTAMFHSSLGLTHLSYCIWRYNRSSRIDNCSYTSK